MMAHLTHHVAKLYERYQSCTDPDERDQIGTNLFLALGDEPSPDPAFDAEVEAAIDAINAGGITRWR